jgi:hypothetical protein
MPDGNGNYTVEEAKQLLDEVKLTLMTMFSAAFVEPIADPKVSVLLSRDQIEIEISSCRG